MIQVMKFKESLDDNSAPYTAMFNEFKQKQQQLPITMSLKRTTSILKPKTPHTLNRKS
jgi:hypothetical protein